MKKFLFPLLALGAVCAPVAARADTYSFNAVLNSANELPPGSNSGATGLASLLYDTHNTGDLGDDTYDFTMSVFGINSTGGPQGQAASAFHIHGAAGSGENGPVLVNLNQSPFVSLNSGTTLLVGGSNVAVPNVPGTPASPTNNGHPAMSFLQLLQGGLAYVNVHSLTFPGGEVRGQLVAVSAVPEPGSAAMLLAGLGMGGLLMMRRRSANAAASA